MSCQNDCAASWAVMLALGPSGRFSRAGAHFLLNFEVKHGIAAKWRVKTLIATRCG